MNHLRYYHKPLVLKVFPKNYPEKRADWSDPLKVGISYVVGYHPNGRNGDSIVYTNELGKIESVISKEVDLVVGYGLKGWDLSSLYHCGSYTLPDHVDVIDVAEMVVTKDRYWMLVDLLNCTLNDDFSIACDYQLITDMWLKGTLQGKRYAIDISTLLLHSIYELYLFAEKYGYVLVDGQPALQKITVKEGG